MSDASIPEPGDLAERSAMQDLVGYEVLVGVTGGIAAYKTCTVVSRLVQRGCGVTVVMTEAATHFVGPATFQALTGRRVFTSLWTADDRFDHQHIRLPELADLIVIAPATANIIGKIAGGIGDDLLSTTVMSADSPTLLAPAMNARMWSNPIVQANVERLSELEYHVVGPERGWLSCRSSGQGRMSEPEAILEAAVNLLTLCQPKSTQGDDPAE